jgi:hypothetical protein
MKATKIDINKELMDIDSSLPYIEFVTDDYDHFIKMDNTINKVESIDLSKITYKKIYTRTPNGEEVILLKAEDEQYIRALIRAEKENVDYQIRIAVRKREEQIKRSNWWKRLFNKY